MNTASACRPAAGRWPPATRHRVKSRSLAETPPTWSRRHSSQDVMRRLPENAYLIGRHSYSALGVNGPSWLPEQAVTLRSDEHRSRSGNQPISSGQYARRFPRTRLPAYRQSSQGSCRRSPSRPLLSRPASWRSTPGSVRQVRSLLIRRHHSGCPRVSVPVVCWADPAGRGSRRSAPGETLFTRLAPRIAPKPRQGLLTHA
jgi:hypothetical protein